MIKLTFILAAFLMPTLQDEPGKPLWTRNLQISGWYCNGAGCQKTPRQFIGDIDFDINRSTAATDLISLDDPNWSVALVCDVSKDRLTGCQVDEQTSAFPKAINRALTMARMVRLDRMRSVPKARRLRAFLMLSFSPGPCGFVCIPTPMPPNPPPTGALR